MDPQLSLPHTSFTPLSRIGLLLRSPFTNAQDFSPHHSLSQKLPVPSMFLTFYTSVIPRLKLYESHSFTKPHSVQMWSQASVLQETVWFYKKLLAMQIQRKK